jgi:hypothetical protein
MDPAWTSKERQVNVRAAVVQFGDPKLHRSTGEGGEAINRKRMEDWVNADFPVRSLLAQSKKWGRIQEED